MKVPVSLADAFKEEFEVTLTDFLFENKLIPEKDALKSRRFMSRSVAPHVEALSLLFNRITLDEAGKKISVTLAKTAAKEAAERQSSGKRGAAPAALYSPAVTRANQRSENIDEEAYWSEGGNSKNRRLAYFLSFMPCNLFRVASVWSELCRLGFKWPFPQDLDLRAIEWGAGTASGACGIIAGEKHAPVGLPERGSFALIEQSKAALTLGTKWFEAFTGYSARPFHRRVDLLKPWLPPAAPKFHLFVMSYFLNETESSPELIVQNFVQTCEKHLEDEGLVIIVEPALKIQSRKLLAFRKSLLANLQVSSGAVPLKVLLPCLGHQACGALAKEDDWCHEEVGWWRPPYLRELDSLTGLDRKTLPFSYLVIQKTKRSLSEVLPKLTSAAEQTYRLVSPSHKLGKKTYEFYVCGPDGKKRARFVVPTGTEQPDRGDILTETKMRGESNLTQIDQAIVID